MVNCSWIEGKDEGRVAEDVGGDFVALQLSDLVGFVEFVMEIETSDAVAAAAEE